MQNMSVSTLQTGYHCVQASSQDKEQGVHLCAATCPIALDLASLLRRAPALPRVPRLWASPPWWCGLRRYHVSRGSGLRLLGEVVSDSTSCSTAPDSTSLLRWAPVLPHPLSFRPRFPAREDSDASTYLMAPDSASPRGELRCHHVSHDSQWAVGHENKESLRCPRHAARLAYSQGTLVPYQGAYKMCRHAASS
jgi:hypothetical protein